MGKIKGRFNTLIIMALVFVLWNTLVLVIADLENAGNLFWLGFAFTDFSFVVSALIVFLGKAEKNVNFSSMFPIYLFTSVYFGITLFYNIIMLIVNEGSTLVALIPNIVIIVLYVISLVIGNIGVSHIKNNNDVINKKIQSIKTLSVIINSVASSVDDSDIKLALLDLKSKIDYSDPLGVSQTQDAETEFSASIVKIRTAVENEEDKENILKMIKSASIRLRERNDMLKILK